MSTLLSPVAKFRVELPSLQAAFHAAQPVEKLSAAVVPRYYGFVSMQWSQDNAGWGPGARGAWRGVGSPRKLELGPLNALLRKRHCFEKKQYEISRLPPEARGFAPMPRLTGPRVRPRACTTAGQ